MNQPSLDQSPKKKSSWMVNSIFVLLALAFIATSIDTRFFFFESPVLSIGNKKITKSELQQLFLQEIALLNLEHSYGDEINPAFLLSKIENNELLNLEVENLGIRVSQEAARQALYAQKAFQDTQGHFSQHKVNEFLSSRQISIKQLIEGQRKAMARQRLKKVLIEQAQASHDLLELTVKGMFQKRKGGYLQLTLKPDEMAKIQPTQAQLQEMFKKTPLHSPEQRTYSILYLSPDLFIEKLKGSEPNKEILLQKARARLETAITQIEDGVGAGKNLKELASQQGIPLIHITSDNKGLSIEGNELFLAAFQKFGKNKEDLKKAILNKVFSMNPEQGTEFLQLPSSTCLWVHLDKITPSHVLTYDQAKGRLESLYCEAQEQRLLTKKAEKFLTQKNLLLDNMTEIDPIGQEDDEEDLPPAVKQALFQLTPGGASIAKDGKKVYVVKLVSISYQPEAEKNSAAKELIQGEWCRIFWLSYLKDLMKKHPIKESKPLTR